MKQLSNAQKQLMIASFIQREDVREHHAYEEELLQFIYVMNGDMRSVEETKRQFYADNNGTLSSDPLRHYRYLFVASTTLVTRYAIKGGVPSQDAYNLSDLFIQRMDRLGSIEEITELNTEMMKSFTEQVAKCKKTKSQLPSHNLYSKKIEDYVYLHLHEKITIEDLAMETDLSPNYLCTLFKKENGITLKQYILNRKIEVASVMLLHSEYSLTDIGNILAFSSTSHFIAAFKSVTGKTPRQYQVQTRTNSF